MKEHPDINDTLRTEGEDAARARHDKAPRYKSNGTGGAADDRANSLTVAAHDQDRRRLKYQRLSGPRLTTRLSTVSPAKSCKQLNHTPNQIGLPF